RIDPEIVPRPVNQKTDPIQGVAAPQIEHILSLNVAADVVTPFGMVEVGRQADQTGVEIPNAPVRYPLAEKVSRNERNHAGYGQPRFVARDQTRKATPSAPRMAVATRKLAVSGM